MKEGSRERVCGFFTYYTQRSYFRTVLFVISGAGHLCFPSTHSRGLLTNNFVPLFLVMSHEVKLIEAEGGRPQIIQLRSFFF